MKKGLLTLLSGAVLITTPLIVHAQTTASSLSKASVLTQPTQANSQTITQEYNWLEHNTKLNKKAIIGVIATCLYETNNDPGFNKDGQGILAWNGVASIEVDHNQGALDSQLNYLKATMNVRGKKFINELNKQKTPMDAALYFEKNYEDNDAFHSRSKRVYRKAEHRLKHQVLTVQKIVQYQ